MRETTIEVWQTYGNSQKKIASDSYDSDIDFNGIFQAAAPNRDLFRSNATRAVSYITCTR